MRGGGKGGVGRTDMQRIRVFGKTIFLILLILMGVAFDGQVIAEGHEKEVQQSEVIFYLHGKIIEDQGPNAKSDRYGRYEYEAILEALGSKGHRVISEVRTPKTDPWEYAKKVATEIKELKSTGVQSESITIVGASKGAAIAIFVSHLLEDANINYVLLAICGPQMLEFWDTQNICIAGNLLSIYEMSDELAGPCETLAARCSTSVTRYNEIALKLDVGHGIVYKPYEEWVTPTLEWGMSRKVADEAESDGR
jgi:hypothetical protein